MHNHRVRLIEQDELPKGTDWALVELEGRICVFLTPAALSESGLGEAWAAYRLLVAASPHPLRPAPLHALQAG